ncbi:MAG: hypothetical protein SF182_07235 [Deltaproteobacteria bacterium]|nr:hypothetical protein [Deltaproteobacteria bacterium]
MSTSEPRPLATMRAIADRLVGALTPFVEKIEIAGSIRRQKPEPRDIELVCVPRFGRVTPPGELLPVPGVNLLDHYVAEQMAAGRMTTRLDVHGRGAVGEKYKRLAINAPGVGPVALDLFSVLPPASFAVLLMIRTGSMEFSRRLVTKQHAGGWLPNDLRVEHGAIWRGDQRIETPDEAAVFELCGRAFVAPPARA